MSRARRVVVVTGATSGIGRAVSLALASPGTELELIGRDAGLGARVVDAAVTRGARARFRAADLADTAAIIAQATDIAACHPAIDVLINNAGARNLGYVASPGDLEQTFAANHLGHFALTCALLERLLASEHGTVVTISSGTHTNVREVLAWRIPRDEYDGRRAYAQSKLANVLFAYELARRTSDTALTSNAFDPGGVASGFARNDGWRVRARHLLSHALRRDLVTPGAIAAPLMRLATRSGGEPATGRYYYRYLEAASSPLSRDLDLAAGLWSLSVALAGLDARNCAAWNRVRP